VPESPDAGFQERYYGLHSRLSILDNKKVLKVKRLMREGKVKQAMKIVDFLEEIKDLADSEQIEHMLLKCQVSMLMGEFSDTIRIFETILKEDKHKLTPLQEIDTLLMKLELKKSFWKLRESNDLVKQIEDKLTLLKGFEEKKVNKRTAKIYLGKSYLFIGKGDMENALLIAEKSKELYIKIEDEEGLADSFLQIGRVFDSSGKMDLALENYEKGLKLRKRLNDIPGTAEAAGRSIPHHGTVRGGPARDRRGADAGGGGREDKNAEQLA